MFHNKNIFIILPILILFIIIFIIGVIVYQKKKENRESFNGPCDCNNNVWDNYFKIIDQDKGSRLQCSTSGCDISDQSRLNDAYDSKKLNAMIPYFNSFTDILINADFRLNNQGQYKGYLDNYKSQLTDDYNMITKINSSGWGSSSSSYKTNYNERWAGVSMGWTILNDLISSYELIIKYFESDVSVFDDFNYNTIIKPIRDRFYDYRYQASNYSDKNSNVGGNNHSSRNNSFWKAIYNTYECLAYLGDLILFYQKNPVPDMGTLREHVNSYKDYFNGEKIADYNVDNIDASVNHIYKYFSEQLNGYAGDNYLSSGIVGDSNISDSSNIAQTERTYAYNNYFYETLGNCNNLYNDTIDNWSDTVTRFDSMNDAKTKLGESLFTNSSSSLVDAVNYTKGVFWDDTAGTWRPNQDTSNYSFCNPIQNGEIQNNVSNVDIYNFKNESDTAELRRKKIQYARKNVFSALNGIDVQTSTISEYLPVCPVVDNQENTDISSWTRSDDSDQDSVCIQKNSFASDPRFYKIGKNTSNPTLMKPGCLLNGQDIWLENYQTIKDSLSQLSAVTGNSYDYNNRDSKHTDLMRQAGVLQGEILKDRDWAISKYKWNTKRKKIDTNNESYFVKKYLSMFTKIKVNNTPIYDFKIEYQLDNDEQVQTNCSVILINDTPVSASNIKIRSLNDNTGCIRLYQNMYQYSDFLTGNINPIIDLPSINSGSSEILSIIYNNIHWELDEMVDYGYDLNIICSNTQNSNNLYSTQNGFLYHQDSTKFGKIYYSPKNSNNIPESNFLWTIFKNTNNNLYMLYNKQSQKFMGLGTHYQMVNNYNLGTAYSSANDNLDDNTQTRHKTLYFAQKSSLLELKSSGSMKDTIYYNNMIEECSWYIQSNGDNKYSIQHSSGALLWFSSDTFQGNSNTTASESISEVLTSYIGYLGFSDSQNQEEEMKSEESYSFCDSIPGNNCYNRYFYIVPEPPQNITNKFTTWSISSTKASNIFSNCSNQQGNNPLDNSKWFSSYNANNKYSYADIKNPENNQYSDLYNLYGTNGDYSTGVLSLEGGDGDNCSSSNFCHISKSLLSQELSDGKVNGLNQTTLPSNNQTKSQNITVSYTNKDNENVNVTYQSPLKKYNYKCSRNKINVYKMMGNKTTITFNTTMNPNLMTIEDDEYSNNDSNRNLIVSMYSSNPLYKEGRDFGVSPSGTFFWFSNIVNNKRSTKTYLDEKSLKVIYGKHNNLLSKYITLLNCDISSSLKRQKQKIIQWDDKVKFMNIGYTFTSSQVYGYSSTPSQSIF